MAVIITIVTTAIYRVSVMSSVLGPLHLFICRILSTTGWQPHFTDTQTNLEKLINLPKFTHQRSTGAGVKTPGTFDSLAPLSCLIIPSLLVEQKPGLQPQSLPWLPCSWPSHLWSDGHIAPIHTSLMLNSPSLKLLPLQPDSNGLLGLDSDYILVLISHHFLPHSCASIILKHLTSCPPP